MLRTFGYSLALMLCWGCSDGSTDNPEDPDLTDEDASEVVVTFSTGNGMTHTRVPFNDKIPVKIFIYQHQSQGGANLKGIPYKIVEGVTDGIVNDLSIVSLTGGDITDGVLTVRSGKRYDFVAVVNAAPEAKLTDIGFPSLGVLSGFTHGADILAGREEQYVAYGMKNLVVTFNSNGSDQGNLPHLGSAVCMQGAVTSELWDHLNGSISFAVVGMNFKQCLPKSANLSFADNPFAMAVQGVGFNTSYFADLLTAPVDISSVSESVTSVNGYLLPYPLLNGALQHNVLNIDFHLRVNDGEVVFQAPGIRTPSFDPGYRYKFIIELDYETGTNGVVNLYLSVEPWSVVSWESGMGEDDNESLMMLKLGSWSSVTWTSPMGDDNSTSKIITSVSEWKSTTWMSQMGK